jgi:hypothetical protein
MKSNVVLISSIIYTPTTPLSYSKTRSVFSAQDRFDQTKKTIQTIRDKIPNSFIILLECSDLSDEMESYIKKHTNVCLNMYSNIELRNNMFSPSKSLGESTQIKHGLQYIKDTMDVTTISSIIKISGRYWLSDVFSYPLFDIDKVVVKCINSKKDNVFTALYKIPIAYLEQYLHHIETSKDDYIKCIGLEVNFAKFIQTIPDENKIFVSPIGLDGFVSVNGNKYSG